MYILESSVEPNINNHTTLKGNSHPKKRSVFMFLSDSPSEMMNFKKKLGRELTIFLFSAVTSHGASRNFTGQSTLTA